MKPIRYFRCGLGVVMLLCLSAGVGVGQGQTGDVATATAVKAETEFFRGFKAYRKGDFFEAIQGFQSALSHVNDRVLLYNIARSHEREGDVVAALTWYEGYLATDPIDVSAVQRRVARLRVTAGLEKKTDKTDSERIRRRLQPPRQAEPQAHRSALVALGPV